MQCPRCQQDNPAHARFCLGCGSRLALPCGACGAELPGTARFCLQCGQAVATFTAAERSAAPETYTPRHLAEKNLTSKAPLEGERTRLVTKRDDDVQTPWAVFRRVPAVACVVRGKSTAQVGCHTRIEATRARSGSATCRRIASKARGCDGNGHA